jgi:hypothetical protein
MGKCRWLPRMGKWPLSALVCIAHIRLCAVHPD